MKLDEMADVLDGLATTFEKQLGKTALSDMRAVGACLRKFPGENVATFCNYIIQAKEGKAARGAASSAIDMAKVDEQVAKIRHYLDNRHSYDYPEIRTLAQDAEKQLKKDEMKILGDRIGCPFAEKSKKAMVERLRNWLSNIKLSADQSSFSMTGTH